MTLGHKLNLEYIESLASQILLYKKLYYTGKASISDELYDSLEEELQKLDSMHPVLSQVGYVFKSENNKIRHEPPMLSLAKTYDENELKDFLLKYPCVVSDKLDGMALALEYDGNGVLKNASTRGNGALGEDVTEHVMHVLSIPKRLKLPLKMNEYTFEVRGEVFFPLSKFEPFSERFESYRNAIPGTLGEKKLKVQLTF
jgi:DNA ligase (NAD+)